MFTKLGSLVNRRPGVIAGLWLAFAVGLTLFAPTLQDVATLDDTALLPSDAVSQRAATAIGELFPADPGRNVALVSVSRTDGLTAQDRQFLADVVAAAQAEELGFVPKRVQSAVLDPALAPILLSLDGAAELALIELPGSPFEPSSGEAVASLRAHIADSVAPGLEVHVTGLAGIGHDQSEAILESIDRTALITVALILLILMVIYRAPVAAVIPLGSIGVSFLIARALIALLAQAGFTIAGTAETFMMVLVFGAGTDYTLFLVSRYREEAGVHPGPDALQRTTKMMGGVLAAAAATVIVGFLSMTSADFGMYRTTGPSVALAIAVTLAASLTLTPALLSLAGRWAFWPTGVGGQAHGARGQHRWERVARLVRKWPAEVLLAGTVALLLASTGLGWFQMSYDLVGDLPESADSRQGFEDLSEHFPAGTLAPIHLLVRHGSPLRDDEVFAAIDQLTDQLREQPGVGSVRSITQPAGAPLTLDTVTALTGGGDFDLAAMGLDPDLVDITPLLDALESPEGLRFTPSLLDAYPQLAQGISPFFEGNDGRSTRLIIELAGNPFTAESLDTIASIDDVAAQSLAGTALTGAQVLAGGPASFYVDVRQISSRDFTVILVVLLLGTFLVMAALVRALVTPLYLLVTVLLSYTATLGLTVLASRWLFDIQGMAFWVPPFLLVILVALGADYNIFIISRIREELDAGHSVAEAASRGLVFTGGVITSAGLILAGTFAALMVSPMPNLRQVGFAVTVGVLLDTFLVRSILVPAATILLGRWAFWPSTVGAPQAATTPSSRGRRALPALASIAGLVALLLGASMLPGVAAPSVFVPEHATSTSRSEPDANDPQRPATAGEQPSSPNPESTSTSSPAEPAAQPSDLREPEQNPPTSGPDTQDDPSPEPSPTQTDTQGFRAPREGGWTYRRTGTRKIGAAGSEQSFDEQAITQVRRVGGQDAAPEVEVRTETSSGTQTDTRRYSSDLIELLETDQSSGAISFGGALDPALVLAQWSMQVGDSWTHQGTVGDGTTVEGNFEVTGTDVVTVAGVDRACWIIESTVTFTGDVDGRDDERACWILEMGMTGWSVRDSQGTYNGISFDIHTEARLTAMP